MQRRKNIGKLVPILGTAGLLAMATPPSAATNDDGLNQLAQNECTPINHGCGKRPAILGPLTSIDATRLVRIVNAAGPQVQLPARFRPESRGGGRPPQP